MTTSSQPPEIGLSGPVVIKVGGSLLTWPELPGRFEEFLASEAGRAVCPGREIVLIAGGGSAADVVRNLDCLHGLGDSRAHRLAIAALDLTANLLAAILSGSVVVHRPETLRSIWNLGRLPVLLPGRFLEDHDDTSADPLPASWDVTSDSIAARIAIHLNASRLILLKSKSVPPGTSLEEAASLGLVDPMFLTIARDLRAVISVCLRNVEPTPLVLQQVPRVRESPRATTD